MVTRTLVRYLAAEISLHGRGLNWCLYDPAVRDIRHRHRDSMRALVLFALLSGHEALHVPSRRIVVQTALACTTSSIVPGAASAFDNAIPDYAKYADKAKRPGTPLKDLGIAKRTINADSIDEDPVTFNGLRTCTGKPNCFSTTGDTLLSDRIQQGVDTLIPYWVPPAKDTEPFKSLVTVVKAYEPGQGNVDGGGFKVVKETNGYIYVQYEALKKVRGSDGILMSLDTQRCAYHVPTCLMMSLGITRVAIHA